MRCSSFEKRYRVTSMAPCLRLTLSSPSLLHGSSRSFFYLFRRPARLPSRWTRAPDFTGCRAEFGRRIFSLEMVNWACAGANERLYRGLFPLFAPVSTFLRNFLASLTLHGPPYVTSTVIGIKGAPPSLRFFGNSIHSCSRNFVVPLLSANVH